MYQIQLLDKENSLMDASDWYGDSTLVATAMKEMFEKIEHGWSMIVNRKNPEIATVPVWTKPYCGVQHRTDLPKRMIVTVVDRGEWAEAYAIDQRVRFQGFTRIWEVQGTLEEVIKKAEAYRFIN